jgi:DNA polymerase-3 subunit chi
MLNLSFYILPTENEQQRRIFCCKLIEKAYRQQCFCYLLTDSDSQSRLFDSLLWSFRPTSFIPHQLYLGQLPAAVNGVLIGSLPPPKAWQKWVINFSSQPVNDLTNTERLLEIIDNELQRKQAGRARYRHYQQQGIKIDTYKL